MNTLYLLLLVAALVCFVISAFQVRATRVNPLALGAALWVLVPILQFLNHS